MRIVVIFESMFGETRQVASAIEEGLAPYGVVTLANVNFAGSVAAAQSADFLVIGGPTHVHGMSRPASRLEAENWANDVAKGLTLETLAPGIGVREWIDALKMVPPVFAAFDTRIDTARILSGAASGGIAYRMTQKGSRALVPPVSFLLTKEGRLEEDELVRAREWGVTLGEARAALRLTR